MAQLLINLLILAAIAAFLALLLEIAHKYLADYGEVKVTVNQEKELTVQGGSSLLSTLGEQSIFIPSACGGRGTCAYCKVKVLDGGGPVLPTETPYLTQEEIEDHVRLSCQVKVRNDVQITIPEELFLIKEFPVTIAEMTDLTPVIKGLKLDIASPDDGLVFKPGQYVQLEVPKFELTKGPEFRAFSIASGPGDERRFELFITFAPEGVVAIYVHKYLKVGDRLMARGPYGDFFLRDSDSDVLLIATGSGLAPIRSILHQFEKQKIERKAVLFFGGRSPEDLYCLDELKRLENDLADFTFVPVLSRVKPEDNWAGETGRVTGLIEKRIEGGDNLEVYICGSPPMVESCVKLLTEKGVPEEKIFFDKFA